MSNKMREIKIGPVPIANVSCFNDDVWDTKGAIQKLHMFTKRGKGVPRAR